MTEVQVIESPVLFILHAKVRCNKMKSGVRWTDGNRPGVSQSVSDGTLRNPSVPDWDRDGNLTLPYHIYRDYLLHHQK